MSNVTATIVHDDEVIFVCNDDYVNLTSHDTCRVVDYDALFYLTSQKYFFSVYTNNDLAM